MLFNRRVLTSKKKSSNFSEATLTRHIFHPLGDALSNILHIIKIPVILMKAICRSCGLKRKKSGVLLYKKVCLTYCNLDVENKKEFCFQSLSASNLNVCQCLGCSVDSPSI